jgi:hypothetical protein
MAPRFYDVRACWRKSDYESDMGTHAADNGDSEAARLHFANAKLWSARAEAGGYDTSDDASSK